jgi:shikimate kinase
MVSNSKTLSNAKGSAKLIFIIGMPGAGKTHWGAQIAEQYELEFIDMDVYVVSEEKASIPALFASYGENGFREREHKHLMKIINKTAVDTVIACGGGTPLFLNNMQEMKASGTVVYLEATVQELLIHLSQSAEIRPLLRGKSDLGKHLEELLSKRKKIYEAADHIIPTKLISVGTFKEIISSCINRQ